MYAIGQASMQSGVNIETIRYYERKGIVPAPGRSAAGRRVYTGDEIAKLRLVKRCRDMGFPMGIIQTLLSLATPQDRHCGEVKLLAEGHLDVINAKIAALIDLRDSLQQLSQTCNADAAACPMLDILMQGTVSGDG